MRWLDLVCFLEDFKLELEWVILKPSTSLFSFLGSSHAVLQPTYLVF